MKVGLVIVDEDPAVAVEVAKAADAAGIHSIWSIDYYNRSSLARSAAFAAATGSVLVGTSVTPLFARSPIALAAAATDIQLLSGGRFVLGVGSSTRRMNRDWYDVDLDHPAPRVEERVDLVRRLMAHHGGPFTHEGRFDAVHMAHFERAAPAAPAVPILVAGVGARMTRAAARSADGFFGHTVASVANLTQLARPIVDTELEKRGCARSEFAFASQIVAAADPDPHAARKQAAAQVGFYSTPKGYDALFTSEVDEAHRVEARNAFLEGDAEGVVEAGLGLVDDRAVFGRPEEVRTQLERYADVLDLALLYPPNFGVDPQAVTRNEYELIDVAAEWNRSG
ncbi:LLM class flavin-dependent oxidoreductase [Amycolatopsis jejuensis]|uniref:LLM class flavin-dependent oxidoreductase n=1 Tax=Amycolatopsis jejuensis TaxID=330084 RepID=UPI0005276475|nr:LLM class flavin-dependent oxidoreductase [Amycolatopsis jejuensis]